MPQPRLQQREESLRTHEVMTADILPKSKGSFFACTKCGAYAWKRRGKLMEQCPGHPNTPELRKQLNRLQDYCFPGEQNLAIGPLRHLSQAEQEKL